MKPLEISAKTVAEAIQIAMDQLNASREEIKVEILSAGKSGIFGVGTEEAVIQVERLSPMPELEEDAHNKKNVAEVAGEILETLLDLMDIDAIIPLDDFIAQEGGDAFISNFLEGFMKIARFDGKIWSIPWQRSTPIMYYNKDFYREAGLDPEKPASTWDELAAYAKKLTVVDSGGNVQRWGVLIPNDYWLTMPLLLQAGGVADNEAGTYIAIDTEEMRDVYRFLHKMAYELKVTTGVTPWSQSVSDFATGKTAMLYHSTGALTYIRNSTKYDFGCAFLPRNKRQVVIEGGGNFFIFKTDERHQAAAWKMIKWMTKPENTAKWSVGSGYIPVRKEAIDLPEYKAYTDKWPQALVAYRQLIESEVERNMMTHRMQEIYDMLNVVDEKIRGSKDLSIMDQVLKEAQADADKILAKWQ